MLRITILLLKIDINELSSHIVDLYKSRFVSIICFNIIETNVDLYKSRFVSIICFNIIFLIIVFRYLIDISLKLSVFYNLLILIVDNIVLILYLL